MSKHTPGPWKVTAAQFGEGDEVAEVSYSIQMSRPEISQANADLIASAPELLEALRWLTHVCCGVGKGGNPPGSAERDAAIKAGQDAIAKAEGKS